ncbi:MAG: glutamine--tRNA ligase, partial [Gammaproteobacteria bacterium]|nr:glutamine--tRNA ligase [Gammaproteobacteria bacterium]
FDDTNPEKEDTEYVDSIVESVKWLGFDWAQPGQAPGSAKPYQASDYFDFMYRAAEYLIGAGLAYVDEQSAEEIRLARGDFNTPGTDSPFRNRSAAENLERFRAMRDGQLPDGAAVLRARIDMASPNINLRDPALYRIRRATHHNTGDTWCIYPMYTYAHPIEDALEQITHSICTLEFEDQRPFYDWLLDRLAEGGLIASPHPRQYEFARLNVTHVITSKRRLRQLVEEGHVEGWDDPRMPTLAGLRRRGYTPEALKLFCERSGVTKSGGWIDYVSLEAALRDTLDPVAPRAMAVLDPVRLVMTNWDEVMGAGFVDDCSAPVHPHHADWGKRSFKIGREVWIERSDYEDVQPKGFFRLFPGNKVRLKYGHVVECIGATRDAQGRLIEVQARLVPDTKSGTPGADAVKVKGNITWVALADAVPAEIRLYERLFAAPQPGSEALEQELNPRSLVTSQGYVQTWLAAEALSQPIQVERHGYFSVVRDNGGLVLIRAATLRDSWTP